MSLDTAKATVILRSLTKKFDNRVQMAKPFYPRICMIIDSDGYDEEYGMLGSAPGVREWVGDRVWNEMRAAKQTVINKDWESGVKIKKNDIDDDRAKLYAPLIEQLALEAALHPDDLLLSTVVPAGDSTACFDGQYFYDTDHSWGDSGTQSNALTYNATDHTAVTAAEFRAAYHQARTAMIKFKNDQGKPHIRPVVTTNRDFVVMVPPELELAAKTGLTAALLSGGDTNVVLDQPEIVCCPFFTSAVKFQLHYTGGVMKPFCFQAREPISRFTHGMQDPTLADILFGTNARYNVAYGCWWTSVQTTFN